MTVQVEFYGIPRARAGTDRTTAEGATLGAVLADLAARFPQLAATCFALPGFANGYTANVGGDHFTVDPAHPLAVGTSVLILSIDAGG